MSDLFPLTLRQAFERFHNTSELRPRTVVSYRGSLGHWERCTGNPSVETVTNVTMLAFREAFATSPAPATGRPPSRNTVRRVLRELEAIFAKIGPAVHGNPFGLGLIPMIPCTRKPDELERQPVTASPEEIAAIYRACDMATWPRQCLFGIAPADWWRCLVVYLYNVGSRRNEFLELRWRDVDLSAKRLTIDPLKKGRYAVKPIHPELARHMLRMVSPRREFWFAAPKCHKSLYAQWLKIQQAAGIVVARPEDLARRPVYTFHEIRKTCGTVLFGVSPGTAQQMLGHASVETTRKYYANLSTISNAAVHQVPQPFAPAEPPPTDPTPGPRPRLRIVG